jgi:L-seryl-tRNA(Ser) seleniumtransferase
LQISGRSNRETHHRAEEQNNLEKMTVNFMDQKESRKIPGVDRLLEDPEIAGYVSVISQPLVADTIRRFLEEIRNGVLKGGKCPERKGIVAEVLMRLAEQKSLFTIDVINATGVIIHTNLGRAPLGRETIEKVAAIGGGYANLEFNISQGRRGFRGDNLERLIATLTGSEDATVVNNNAGAVFLIVSQFAKGREVIISRGELIQIGGGFRIPAILEQSGAILREVGTTNHTDLEDYDSAIRENTAMILKVHHSNFFMRGFVHSPADSELAALSDEKGLVFVYDTGSGALVNTERYGLAHEPTAQDAVRAGADLVCFSGDKLLGGPQAGIIAGKSEFVAPLKKHPLFRALRPDKLCLGALEQTLIHYLRGEAEEKIPVLRMLSMKPEEIGRRAKMLVKKLRLKSGLAAVVEGESAVGGGSLPGQTLPTFLAAVKPGISPDEFARKLRLGNPPVIARIADDTVLFDLRTVPEDRDADLAKAINKAI